MESLSQISGSDRAKNESETKPSEWLKTFGTVDKKGEKVQIEKRDLTETN